VLENVPTAGFVAVHSSSNGELVAVISKTCLSYYTLLCDELQGVTGGEAMNHISPNMVVQVSDPVTVLLMRHFGYFFQAGNEMRKIDGVVVDANVPQVCA
jgi:hypothetical protein